MRLFRILSMLFATLLALLPMITGHSGFKLGRLGRTGFMVPQAVQGGVTSTIPAAGRSMVEEEFGRLTGKSVPGNAKPRHKPLKANHAGNAQGVAGAAPAVLPEPPPN